MRTNKNSRRQKCGDIFINIKTIKNKAKVFTFHCTICSMDCDQLKKFSKHLESHLQYFENDLINAFGQASNPSLIFESEGVNEKPQLDVKLTVKDECNVGNHTESFEYEDPLETRKLCKSEVLLLTNIKNEGDDVDEIEDDNVGIKVTGSDHLNNLETSEINEAYPNIKREGSLTFGDSNSDDYLGTLSESELELENELKATRKVKRSKAMTKERKSHILEGKGKMSTKEANENDPKKAANINKPKKRRRVIIESILPFLIQQYKNHKILWQIDDIAYGIKQKKYEIYNKIAEMLKLEANIIISLEDINYHINYLNELYSKDKEQELKCKMEKEKFIPEYEHYKEMSFLCNSQGPFLCAICKEILPRYHSYCYHMAQHNETPPYKCPSCDSMFSNYHKYLVHKKRHMGILDFHCHICGKGYMFKNDLEFHVTSHTGKKPFLCPICGTGFRARHHYDNHVRRHEERYRYECHICKRGFNQLHALKSHVKSHLNIRDVICQICGKGFTHSKYLKRHELIHGKEKRYKCVECGKDFFQHGSLRAHQKIHHSQ